MSSMVVMFKLISQISAYIVGFERGHAPLVLTALTRAWTKLARGMCKVRGVILAPMLEPILSISSRWGVCYTAGISLEESEY